MIMMLTLPLQGSRSENCQLQATPAAGMKLGCDSVRDPNPPPSTGPETPLTVCDRLWLFNYT